MLVGFLLIVTCGCLISIESLRFAMYKPKLQVPKLYAVPKVGVGELAKSLIDLETILADKKCFSKSLNATIIKTQPSGISVKLDKFNIQGFVPTSSLECPSNFDLLRYLFPSGKNITVKISEVTNDEPRRVIFGILPTFSMSAVAATPTSNWLIGVIKSVTKFGLFVRISESDVVGLVHVSRIPKELIAALVSRCKSYNRSLSELENIFSAEDVVSVRVQSVVVEDKKIDLSMLPHRVDFLTGDEVSDDAKNGDEIFASGRESDKELEQIIAIVDEQRRKVKKKEYCCHDTLLWWRGSRYMVEEPRPAVISEELTVMQESGDASAGMWRRSLEGSNSRDEAGSKSREAFNKDIDNEIGELIGLHTVLSDPLKVCEKGNFEKLGHHVGEDFLPAEMKSQTSFFGDMNEVITEQDKVLKAGKAFDLAELQSLTNRILRDRESKKTL